MNDFKTETAFVYIDDQLCKVSFCLRSYKNFPQIYDMYIGIASLHWGNQGLIAEMEVTGSSKADALKLSEKFLRSIGWQK